MLDVLRPVQAQFVSTLRLQPARVFVRHAWKAFMTRSAVAHRVPVCFRDMLYVGRSFTGRASVPVSLQV